MRAFSCVCLLPVTWQRWRTSHSIRRYSGKPHATRKLHGCVFYGAGVTDRRRLREKWFSTFIVAVPWPWPDDLHIRPWLVFPGDRPTPDVQIWTSYVKAFESYSLTDVNTYTQTDTTTMLRGWSKILSSKDPGSWSSEVRSVTLLGLTKVRATITKGGRVPA